jgi:hypothetical protein
MYRRMGMILLALALAQLTAFAWESDVHYILTWWLATQAGFSRGDADAIARADQGFDDSDHNSAIPTVAWIVISDDAGAARDLQKKHFPSDAQLPSPPQRRVVVPNSDPARAAVVAAIRPNTDATALQELGEGMHPFQDSWSHQGVPDVPFRPFIQPSPNLSSAHPENRGGWYSHDADLTYLHRDEVIEMAHETYKLLVEFLDKNPRFRASPSVNWDNLMPVVRELAVARTQAEKNAWAVKYVPAQAGRAATNRQSNTSSMTLPGTRMRMPARAIRPPKELSAAMSVPAALVERARDFAQLWMTKQDVSRAVAQYVDTDHLKEQFAGFSPPLEPAAWSRKFLTSYLAEDHAAVNAAGHGIPGSPRYGDLPETPVTEGPFRALRDISVAPIGPDDFVMVKNPLGGPFALVIQPGGLRHDAICFVWNTTAGAWRIVRMFPIID